MSEYLWSGANDSDDEVEELNILKNEQEKNIGL